MNVARFFFGLVALSLVPLLAAVTNASCSPSDASADDGGTFDRKRLDAPFHPDASCPVTIESPDLLPAQHVPEGSQIQWNSNPPSSGPHYPVWANFQEFTAPVDRGYLVHSMEHGAVVMLYKCDPPCPDAVEQLRKIRDSLPSDPMCSANIRVRVVIAPDPLIDVPFAAASWGWTYKAQCVDVPTLTDFAREHIAQSPENICAEGRTF